MVAYFAEFRVIGEVANMLLLTTPVDKLYVDLSPDPPGHESDSYRKYPTRIACTITDDELIKSFLTGVKVGDLLDVRGRIIQSDYVPHKTTHIDTICLVHMFQRLKIFESRNCEQSKGQIPLDHRLN